ncbi:energy transducer TonB [Hyphomonas oceanitis]|uniref:TonB family protein n=1 Tax=Hyphomonas oceanitis SCH89 TaxID=1280953 RepID=A0A059G890_9PROT|nr:energy transducer TonB [Hyphomonas oceanitis]KDA03031.1 TonB family protein [Hyphomonas oceanitis SCH89]
MKSLIALALLALPYVAIAKPDITTIEAEVLEPPRPVFPLIASLLGVSGYCEVRFSVRDYGDTIKIEDAACTSPIFCDAAINAIMKTRYKVTDEEGTKVPGRRDNIVYPMSFLLNRDAQLPNDLETLACAAGLTS